MSCGHIAPSDVHCTSLSRFQTPSVFCRRGELLIQMTHRSRFSWVLTSRYSVERSCSDTASGSCWGWVSVCSLWLSVVSHGTRPGSSVGHHCFASQIHVVSLFGQCQFRLRCHHMYLCVIFFEPAQPNSTALLASALFCTCPPWVALRDGHHVQYMTTSPDRHIS